MDLLGRYYTEKLFSNILVRELDILEPNTIIDLGIGSGSLTNAAHQKWQNANYVAVDIDRTRLNKTLKSYPYINSFCVDALKINLDKKIKITLGSADIAICNPPYLPISNSSKYADILKNAGFNDCISLKSLSSDLIFLAQNLLLLKVGGKIGIILPDTLLTAKRYEKFRKNLISNHTIKLIIQLPDNIFNFNKTEAKTHIVIIEKGVTEYENIKLLLADINGSYIDQVIVNNVDLIKRMDFSYHKWKITDNAVSRQLKDLNVKISRGSFSKHELINLDIKYFHTTNFNKESKEYFFKLHKYNKSYENSHFACKGDIIMSRVGKRCIGKLGIVRSGKILLTDCVYKIVVPPEYLEYVWNIFNSEYGKKWFDAHSHGVCSQVITKEDLLNFKIDII
jgi:type I restriction-modification system DNA methylase subunit